MSGRQLAAILGVLALMLAGWLALRDRDDAGRDGLDLGARIGADVTYVRIDAPGGTTIELERRGDGWTVNGYPAVDSLVEATLGALDTLPPGRLIARRAASHERLGLTPDAAHRVRVGPVGRPAAEFLVGGSGTDGRFVRLPDEEPSYVLPAEVMEPLVDGEAAWRDFTIARVDTAALRRIVIRRGGETAAELTRELAGGDGRGATPWRVNGVPADTARMRLYLDALAELRATGFPADSFVYAADFENPAAAVDLYTGGTALTGPDLSLLLSTGLDHPDVLVRRADDPIVYALDPRLANLLAATAATLRAGG